MATIVKTETGRWRAQIRIKGFPSVAQTFDKKGQAQTWADQTEAKMRNGGFSDARELANFTITSIVDRYIKDIGEIKPFGRSKMGALSMLKRHMGSVTLASLNDDAIVAYAKRRAAMGAGGVTIGLELTYLGGVLRIARSVWKLPYHARPIDDARPSLKLLRLHTKSKERDRRPTQDEIASICNFFASKARQKIPMPDIIQFAIATTMRASEITSLRWDDINHADRTIMIRDRKHPEEKIGNNQIVPLLGEAYDIVMRQRQRGDFIFPFKHHTFSSLFPRACNELKIDDLRFHDLRHEGVSRLFEQGYRIEQVALVSGHRDWKMLRRYTQVRARDLHRDPVGAQTDQE
ncbi:Phage integrase [Paraburkholderia piptadeniae]|uniref:Phage integrase n=1 Tax=Paraburkholderia piptadeniae TaxID=1701573 RepID=A0A1N7S8X9_9BURK|nr:site-specific integrase [Paraburkholderia piptadeniae]SIT43781.1 Phage integrase [Paraburkholderia piptadeniae]